MSVPNPDPVPVDPDVPDTVPRPEPTPIEPGPDAPPGPVRIADAARSSENRQRTHRILREPRPRDDA
jgi:hypothetical protein